LLSTIGAFTIAAGVLTYTAALLHAWRWGRPASRNPWGGDTLEWATESPAPSSNWPTIPLVTDRHPLWVFTGKADDARQAPESHVRMSEAFDHKPVGVRVSPLTSVLSAEPQGAMRLASPTFWPFVPAAGLVVIAVGLLVEVHLLSFAGIGVVVAGLIGWSLHIESEHDEDSTAPVGGIYA